MTNTIQQPIGATAFWSLSGTVSRNRLESEWAAAGFKGCVPAVRRAHTMLGDALADLFSARGTAATVIVRPLNGRAGFAIVDESRGDSSNDYATRMSVRVAGSQLVFSNCDPDTEDRIRAAYAAEPDVVRPAALGAALSTAVTRRLSGVALRPSGGVYWMPLASVEDYNRLAAATAAAGSTGRLHSMTNKVEPETLAAVRDAAIADLKGRLFQVYEHLKEPTLTARGAAARLEDLNEIEKKIAVYEGVLSERLNDLREELRSSVMVAQVTAGALSAAAA